MLCVEKCPTKSITAAFNKRKKPLLMKKMYRVPYVPEIVQLMQLPVR